MDKIYILNENGEYTEAEELDKAIKEQVKINEQRRQDGIDREEQGEAGTVASSTVQP